jgi:hypothetical protein
VDGERRTERTRRARVCSRYRNATSRACRATHGASFRGRAVRGPQRRCASARTIAAFRAESSGDVRLE